MSRPAPDRPPGGRPIRVAVDRLVAPGGGRHGAEELRAGLALSLRPALAGHLEPEAVERVAAALSVSIAREGTRRRGGPADAPRRGGGRDGA